MIKCKVLHPERGLPSVRHINNFSNRSYVLPATLLESWMECWQPEGLDSAPFNLLVMTGMPGILYPILAQSCDFEFRNDTIGE